jgi:transglutaminase-like putative cysteine protease
MKSRNLRTGLLLFSFASGALLAASVQSTSRASAPSHSQQIESLQRRFLAATDPALRNRLLAELKSASHQPADAPALNAALSAMLPAASSLDQAEQLLSIAAANPDGDAADSASLSSDQEFLVDARGAAQAVPQPQGDVEALADIRIDRLGNDGSAQSHVQQLWRINTAQGAKAFASHSLMYAAMSERLCLLHARVLQPTGAEVPALLSADQPVADRSVLMFFDSRTRDLRFPHLEPGDLVEIDYRLLPASEVNPWAGYYARLDLFSDAYATRLRRRVLIAPSGMQLYAVESGIAAPDIRSQDGETTRVWEMRDIAAASTEALSPGATSSGPYLHVSTIGSMEEFGRWYAALLQPALELDANLRELARQILSRNLTTRAKVEAVYEAVQRNTGYAAFEFGVHSYQPYPLALVDQRGFGDCKDKAAMIVALLRAVGVPAEFAMVRTRTAGDIAPEALSVQLFNHAVAYVPDLNLFLDGTVEYAAPGELPPDDQGALAFTVDADGKVTRRIVPFTAPEDSRVTRQVQARLSSDGHLKFVSQTRYAGYFAAVERRTSQSDDLAGSSQAALARFYPTVRVAHAVAEGTARASREVELKVEGDIDAATWPTKLLAPEAAMREAVPAAAHVLTLHSSLHTAALTAKYASLPTRQNPLLLPATSSEHEVFDYELPSGAQARLPADTRLQTPFGRVEVNYHLDTGKLRVETYTELAPLTIYPPDYPAFRAFCQAADQALRREVTILLP